MSEVTAAREKGKSFLMVQISAAPPVLRLCQCNSLCIIVFPLTIHSNLLKAGEPVQHTHTQQKHNDNVKENLNGVTGHQPAECVYQPGVWYCQYKRCASNLVFVLKLRMLVWQFLLTCYIPGRERISARVDAMLFVQAVNTWVYCLQNPASTMRRVS